MKSVLISIQPKWCELIASGKKTVEVRKTKPKLETPFKCYIYCTKDNIFAEKTLRGFDDNGNAIYYKANKGKVIGEFVCDEITPLFNVATTSWSLLAGNIHEYAKGLVRMARLTEEEMHSYAKGKNCYAWHISDLVIYDKPRELNGFYAEGDCDCMNCKKCAWFDRGNGYNVENDCNLAYKCVDLHKSLKPIIRPPQSWCYVESEGKE
jgi:predicted transcriptional regulator